MNLTSLINDKRLASATIVNEVIKYHPLDLTS